jgi:hypothetical protein
MSRRFQSVYPAFGNGPPIVGREWAATAMSGPAEFRGPARQGESPGENKESDAWTGKGDQG